MHLKLSTLSYASVRSLIELDKISPLQPTAYPLHINTGALIKTCDNIFVFGVKALAYGLDRIDIIGGGLQKSEYEVTCGDDLARNILAEMQEEINIASNEIANLDIIGLILADVMSVVIVFEAQLNITFQEVERLFRDRHDFEMSDIIPIPEKNLDTFLATQKNYIALLGPLYSRSQAL